MFKIVYLGNVLKVLRALSGIRGIELVGCIYEDFEDADQFAKLYKNKDIKTYRVSSKDELQIALESLKPIDLGIIANFGLILSEENIQQSRKGFINLHPGLLPHNAGRFPVQNTLKRKDPVTGITLHHVTTAVDEGPVIDQLKIQVNDGSTHGQLFDQVFHHAPNLLHQHLPRILA